MDSIYRDAYLTLVAWTAESSDSALPGVSVPSLRPQISQKHVNGVVLENRLSKDLPYLLNYETISHYNTRAWTFQERILSTRCLFFHEREALLVYKDPKPNIYGVGSLEMADKGGFNVLAGSEAQVNRSMRIYRMIGRESGAPDLESYARLVEEYTKLNLTMISDRLNAFAGILKSLGSTIGHNVAGMPISSTPLCLLWTLGGRLRRNALFPSWSWAGWEGEVSYMNWSSNDKRLMIGPIHGSKTPDDVGELLWEPGETHLAGEASLSMKYVSHVVLHFWAETIEEDGREFLLITAEQTDSPRGRMEAMEIKWGEGCAERVGDIKRLSRGDWKRANPKRKEIRLQ